MEAGWKQETSMEWSRSWRGVKKDGGWEDM